MRLYRWTRLFRTFGNSYLISLCKAILLKGNERVMLYSQTKRAKV